MANYTFQTTSGVNVTVNAPEGVSQEQAFAFASKQQPLRPLVTTQSVNQAAAEEIGGYIPEPVKKAASNVGKALEAGYEALPEGGQKALKSTGNFLLDTISYLDKPRQAVALYGESIGKQASEEDADALRTILGGGNQKAIKDTIAGLKAGRNVSTQQALPDDFRREHPVYSAILGFAGDVVTDPLKTSSIKMIGDTVAPTINAARQLVPEELINNPVFRTFNINTGNVAKAQELFNNYRYLKDKAVNEGIQSSKSWNNQLKLLANQSGMDVADLKAQVLDDIERGNVGLKSVTQAESVLNDLENPAAAKTALDTLDSKAIYEKFLTEDDPLEQIKLQMIGRNKQLLEIQKEAGVEIGDLGPTYMPHVITKEGKTALDLDEFKAMYGLRSPGKTPQAVARNLEGTVADINARNLYGTEKYFRDDPAILMGYSEFNAANAIAGTKFLEDAKALGVPASEAPRNFVTVPGIKDTLFAPEVANRLSKSYQTLTNSEQLSKFIQVIDGAQRWWKMWTLGARPAYHSKNVIGNMWNSYLGGVTSPVPYGEAAIFQKKLMTDKLTGKIAGIEAKTLYEEMSKRGVFGEGQYAGDIAQSIEKKLEGGSKNPLTPSTENPILQAGFKVGQTLEDNARIAMFIDQVKKGSSYDQAAAHVRKYLFDYGDLSSTERNVFKRFAPFYTWSRKNLPLQLEAIVTHPDKVNKINIARENIQQAGNVEQPDLADTSEYVKEGMPIYYGTTPEGNKSAILLNNFLPFADANLVTNFFNTRTYPETTPRGRLESGASTMVSGLTPLLKAPLELVTNYDFFRKQNIEQYKGQMTDMLGVRMPVHHAKLLSNIVMLNELDRANPYGIFGTRTKDPKTGEVKTTNSIFGNPREKRTDMTDEERTIQYLTGLRTYDINPDEVQTAQAKKLKADISALKGFVRNAYKQGREAEAEDALKALDNFLTQYEEFEEVTKARKKKEGTK